MGTVRKPDDRVDGGGLARGGPTKIRCGCCERCTRPTLAMFSKPPSPPLPTAFSTENISSAPSQLYQMLLSLSPLQQTTLSAFFACATTIGAFLGYRSSWRRVKTADHITPSMLGGRKWIRGKVTRFVDPCFYCWTSSRWADDRFRWTISVGDGDNFRIYHKPGFFWGWPFKLRHVPTDSKGKS